MFLKDKRRHEAKKRNKVIIHKDYHHGCTKENICYENDIAIVRLGKPIKFNNCSDSIKGHYMDDGHCEVYGTFVRPVCLPKTVFKEFDKTLKIQPRTLSFLPNNLASFRDKIDEEKPTPMWITGYGQININTTRSQPDGSKKNQKGQNQRAQKQRGQNHKVHGQKVMWFG